MAELDINQARQTFKSLNSRTSYSQQFGEGPKAKDEYKVTPAYFKTLCSILNPTPAGYLDAWLKINDQEEFTKRIVTTLREVFTVVKNQEAVVSTVHVDFDKRSQYKGSAPPRFDKVERMLKEKQRAHSV